MYSANKKFVPYVTYTIIGLCVLFFVTEKLVGAPSLQNFAMNPIAIGVFGEYYRLISSMFLHIGFMHIGFNMLILYLIGPTMERVLGPVRFAGLYLLAGLGGAVASYMFSSPGTFSVGASGAIYGLMGAVLVVGKQLNIDTRQIWVLLAINLAISFIPGWGIDWRAHIGGLIVGVATAWVMKQSFAPKRPSSPWDNIAVDVYGTPIATSLQPAEPTHRLPSGPQSQLARQVLGVVAIIAVLLLGTMWRTTQLSNDLSNYHSPSSYGASATEPANFAAHNSADSPSGLKPSELPQTRS